MHPRSSVKTARPARWLTALNVLAILATLAAVAIAPTGSRMVVIASPWSEPGRIMDVVTRAGGALVNGGAQDWIVIAEGENGFASRLLAEGAWLVLDGRIAEACLKLGTVL